MEFVLGSDGYSGTVTLSQKSDLAFIVVEEDLSRNDWYAWSSVLAPHRSEPFRVERAYLEAQEIVTPTGRKQKVWVQLEEELGSTVQSVDTTSFTGLQKHASDDDRGAPAWTQMGKKKSLIGMLLRKADTTNPGADTFLRFDIPAIQDEVRHFAKQHGLRLP